MKFLSYGVGALISIALVYLLVFNPSGSELLNQSVFGMVADDPLSFTLILHSMSHNLLSWGPGFWNGNFFFPFQESLALSEPLILTSLLYRFFYALTQAPNLSLNLMVGLIFILNQLSMQFFLRSLVSPLASLLGSLIFWFRMMRIGHLCHIHVLPQFMFPIFAWALVQFHQTSKNKYWFLALFYLALQFYFSLTLGIILATSLIPYFVWILFTQKKWKLLAIGGMFTLVLISPLLIKYFSISHQYGYERVFQDAVYFSANPKSYFVTPQSHRYSAWLTDGIFRGENGNRQEKCLFVGFLVLLLSGYGLSLLKKSNRPLSKNLLVWMALILLFSFGTNGGLFNLFFYFVPGFKAIRTPARFGFSLLFFATVFSSYALHHLLNRYSKIRYTITALFLVLFTYENYFPVPRSTVSQNLAGASSFFKNKIAKKEPILWVPLKEQQGIEMFWATVHEHPISNGWAGFTPPIYNVTVDFWHRFLKDHQWDSIQAHYNLGIRWIAIEKGRLNPTITEFKTKMGEPVFEDDFYCVFRIKDFSSQG